MARLAKSLSGTTAAEIAKQISPRLAKEALVARTNGDLIDLSRPLDHDTKLAILTAKDPDAVQVFRHSAAHLLAAAVMELYPNVKLGIGPPIDTGFFYEFVREEPFTPDDLVKIEAKMRELAAKDVPNERKMIPKPEALELYRNQNQEFKCELVEEKADRARWSPSTAPENSSTSAAAPTFLPPAGSKRSN